MKTKLLQLAKEWQTQSYDADPVESSDTKVNTIKECGAILEDMINKLFNEDASHVQLRLKIAREAATYKAWCDLLEAFTETQRQHIANLMAHEWKIVAIDIQSKHGEPPTPIEGCKNRKLVDNVTIFR